MNLLEQIDHDLKKAMKARDAFTLGTLRMVKSALKYAALEQGGAATLLLEADALAVIRKQIKQREDSVMSFEQGALVFRTAVWISVRFNHTLQHASKIGVTGVDNSHF
jgi:uncharacterized protein YqeY